MIMQIWAALGLKTFSKFVQFPSFQTAEQYVKYQTTKEFYMLIKSLEARCVFAFSSKTIALESLLHCFLICFLLRKFSFDRRILRSRNPPKQCFRSSLATNETDFKDGRKHIYTC